MRKCNVPWNAACHSVLARLHFRFGSSRPLLKMQAHDFDDFDDLLRTALAARVQDALAADDPALVATVPEPPLAPGAPVPMEESECEAEDAMTAEDDPETALPEDSQDALQGEADLSEVSAPDLSEPDLSEVSEPEMPPAGPKQSPCKFSTAWERRKRMEATLLKDPARLTKTQQRNQRKYRSMVRSVCELTQCPVPDKFLVRVAKACPKGQKPLLVLKPKQPPTPPPAPARLPPRPPPAPWRVTVKEPRQEHRQQEQPPTPQQQQAQQQQFLQQPMVLHQHFLQQQSSGLQLRPPVLFTQAIPQLPHSCFSQGTTPTVCVQQPFTNTLLCGQVTAQPLMVMASPSPSQPLRAAAVFQQQAPPVAVFHSAPGGNCAVGGMVSSSNSSEASLATSAGTVQPKRMPVIPPWRRG